MIVNTRPASSALKPATLLEVQREHEEEGRLAAPERELRHQPGGERAVAEHRGHQQRVAAAPGETALMAAKLSSSSGAQPSEIHVQAGQPCCRPSTSGRTMAVRPAVSNTVPTRIEPRSPLRA